MKVNVHMNEELRKKHGRRAFAVRSGDTVKVRKGSFRGTVGKVTSVDRKRGTLTVEGVERTKSDGSKARAPVHSSNVELIELDLSDKFRKRRLKG